MSEVSDRTVRIAGAELNATQTAFAATQAAFREVADRLATHFGDFRKLREDAQEDTARENRKILSGISKYRRDVDAEVVVANLAEGAQVTKSSTSPPSLPSKVKSFVLFCSGNREISSSHVTKTYDPTIFFAQKAELRPGSKWAGGGRRAGGEEAGLGGHEEAASGGAGGLRACARAGRGPAEEGNE